MRAVNIFLLVAACVGFLGCAAARIKLSAEALISAVETGDLATVKEALVRGADVNARDGMRMTALHHAAEKGHAAIAGLLIAAGAKVNSTSVDEEDLCWVTPLDLAEESGHGEVVKLLESHGGRSGELETDLMNAILSMGTIEEIRELIVEGADVNVRSYSGFTPLHEALHDEALIRLLVKSGADLNARDNWGATPLHEAARMYPESIEVLVSCGVNVNEVDNNGLTALDYASDSRNREAVEVLRLHGGREGKPYRIALKQAVQMGDAAKVKELLGKRADVNARDLDSWTPLDWAIVGGHEKIVDMLNSAGAVPGRSERGSDSALHYAIQWGTSEKAVKSLIVRGADVNAKNDRNQTPLYYAVRRELREIASLLIARGADVNVMTEDSMADAGGTALHVAVENGDKEMVNLLLANGADVNAVAGGFRSDGTPLHWAIKDGHREIAELLLANGAEIDSIAAYLDRTPLHWAAKYGRRQMVEFLVSKGADVDAKDENGETPLDYAVKNGHDDVAEVLRKHKGELEKEGSK